MSDIVKSTSLRPDTRAFTTIEYALIAAMAVAAVGVAAKTTSDRLTDNLLSIAVALPQDTSSTAMQSQISWSSPDARANKEGGVVGAVGLEPTTR